MTAFYRTSHEHSKEAIGKFDTYILSLNSAITFNALKKCEITRYNLA